MYINNPIGKAWNCLLDNKTVEIPTAVELFA